MSYNFIWIIRKVIRITEIDQCYANNGNDNSSNISKNDLNT